MGFLEGLRVKYGGVKTAALDSGIRLVPGLSGGAGRRTGLYDASWKTLKLAEFCSRKALLLKLTGLDWRNGHVLGLSEC